MIYKLFGKSGLRVSELCLGAMTFGEEWGFGVNEIKSRKIFDTFAEAGGNFIDTANYYTGGTSEKFLGNFIHSERERFVVATKFSLNMRKGDINGGGNHRKNIFESVHASLKRLNTDYIDLYWLHMWDFTTPIEETMRALDDLISAGKVMYIGISDTPAWIISRANTLAELRGWTPFVGLQIEYSLIERTVERELIPMATALEMSITPWGPLASGLLSGKYTTNKPDPSMRIKEGSKRLSDRNLQIASLVKDIAGKLGLPPSQLALKWLLTKGDNIIPIIGSKSAEQIKESMGCLDIEIPREFLNELNDITQVELGFPHDFLKNDAVKEHLYGGTIDQLYKYRK